MHGGGWIGTGAWRGCLVLRPGLAPRVPCAHASTSAGVGLCVHVCVRVRVCVSGEVGLLAFYIFLRIAVVVVY